MKILHGTIALILILAFTLPVFAEQTVTISGGVSVKIPDKFKQLSNSSHNNRKFLDKSSNILLIVHSHSNLEEKQYEYYVENEKRRQIFNEKFINSFIPERRGVYPSYKLINYKNFDFNGLYGMKIKGEITDSDSYAGSWINSDYLFFNNKTVYGLTLYCPEDIYHKHEKMLDDMAKSIKIK